MMSEIRRFRRKPETRSADPFEVVEFTPGMDHAPIYALAKANGVPGVEVAEIALPTGPLLVVRWINIPDEHPSHEDFETVRPGEFVAYNDLTAGLMTTDAEDLAQWYDEVPQTPA